MELISLRLTLLISTFVALWEMVLLCKLYVKVQDGQTCWSIANTQGLSLNELKALNAEKVTVGSGHTCWLIASNKGLSLDQLRKLNPGLNCDLIFRGQDICIKRSQTDESPQNLIDNDSYCKKKVKVESGDSCWAISDRNGLSLDQFYKVNPGLDCNALQLGQQLCVEKLQASQKPTTGKDPSSCGNQVTVAYGDDCWSISVANKITLDDLRKMNPQLNCDQLQSGLKICVGKSQSQTPESATPKSDISGCSSTATVQSGDTCWIIANNNGLSLSDLQKLNPQVNCNLIQVGQKLCVMKQIESAMYTAAPPKQDGDTSCEVEITVQPGDTCWQIASSNELLLLELIKMNTGVNCDSIQLGQKLCVKRKTDSSGPTTTLASGKEFCEKTVTVKVGDTCRSIASANSILLADLQKMNPEVDCDFIRDGEVLCIMISITPSSTPPTVDNVNVTVTCNKSVIVKQGETCWEIATGNEISVSKLEKLNPKIDCKMLQAGQKLCVEGSSGITKPSPAPTCKRYEVSQAHDTCLSMAKSNDMSVEDLQKLNPTVKCQALTAGQKLCVSLVSSNKPPRKPLKHNIPAECETVYEIEKEMDCSEIEKKHKLKPDQLVEMNPQLPCSKTPLPAKTLVCVKYKRSKCMKEHLVAEGETCWNVWVRYRLTEWQLRKLNKGIDCDFLAVGSTLCVADENIKATECDFTVKAQKGDTCISIAKEAGLTMSEFEKLNEGLDCKKLEAERLVCVSHNPTLQKYGQPETKENQDLVRSAVRGILKDIPKLDGDLKKKFEDFVQGSEIFPEDLRGEMEEILTTDEGLSILKKLENSNKNFQEFASLINFQRPLLCKQLRQSEYKTCICDHSKPFVYCQAKVFKTERNLLRRKRDLGFALMNVTNTFKRLYKRQADDSSNSNPLANFFNLLCGGCFSETGCIDVQKCVPIFAILEACIGGGVCFPHPTSLVESQGRVTVGAFMDSRIGIDLALCITLLNEIASIFGMDVCVAKGGVDYFYLKQQLLFEVQISLLVVRGIVKGRVQVADAYTEELYDTESKKVIDDLCATGKYECENFCQADPGHAFVEWKAEGWFFGWHHLAQGSKNDLPPCVPKPKPRPPPPPPPESLDKIVLYATSWAQYRASNATIDGEFVTRPDSCKPHAKTPKDIDASLVTHLNYAFVVLDEATFQITNFEKNDDELIAEMNALKGANRDLKTLVSVGGWSFSQGETSLGNQTKDVFSNMAKDPESRARFINSAVDFVKSKNFDGIDIDWEYPLEGDRDTFTALIRELRGALGANLLLTFAAPAGRKFYKNIDLENIHDYIDFINLMTYDFHGGSFETDKPPNVNAPIVDCSCPEIEDIEIAIDSYLAAGVPARKINLGMVTYGRTFTLKDKVDVKESLSKGVSGGPGERGVCTLTPGVLSFYEIKDKIDKKDVVIDDKLMSAYASYGNNQWVGYDNQETHDMKICFARRKRLGGIMIWDAEMDDNLELVKHMKENLNLKCENFIIPNCPDSKSRRKRANINPSRGKIRPSKIGNKPLDNKPNKPCKKPPCKRPNKDDDDDDNTPKPKKCTGVPRIPNKDAAKMKSCKNKMPNEICKVFCKKNFEPTEPHVTCKAINLKTAKWSTDAHCQLQSDDCGKIPYPVIKVRENGNTGPVQYIVKLDTRIKLPIWSLYVQKKFTGTNFERENGWSRHDCHISGQIEPAQYKFTGYDKGHLSPQNAFSHSVRAMRTSNLMLNAAPQDPSTNSGSWRILESKVKDFTTEYPGFVVTGLCSGTKTFKKVPVPDCYWKMICVRKPDGSTIVGVFYHTNTKVDNEKRKEEIREVRDQAFLRPLMIGPGRSLNEIWATAATLNAQRSGLPSAASCQASHTLSGGIFDSSTRSQTSDKAFWEENISSNKYGLKWESVLDLFDSSLDIDEDKHDEDDEEAEDSSGNTEEGPGGNENIESDTPRSRCGHNIKY